MESIKSILLAIRELPSTIHVEIDDETFTATVNHQFEPGNARCTRAEWYSPMPRALATLSC